LLGRESVIPAHVFEQVLDATVAIEAPTFMWYLKRSHRSGRRGTRARGWRLLARLCGNDFSRWSEAEASARRALNARRALWTAVCERSSRAWQSLQPPAETCAVRRRSDVRFAYFDATFHAPCVAVLVPRKASKQRPARIVTGLGVAQSAFEFRSFGKLDDLIRWLPGELRSEPAWHSRPPTWRKPSNTSALPEFRPAARRASAASPRTRSALGQGCASGRAVVRPLRVAPLTAARGSDASTPRIAVNSGELTARTPALNARARAARAAGDGSEPRSSVATNALGAAVRRPPPRTSRKPICCGLVASGATCEIRCAMAHTVKLVLPVRPKSETKPVGRAMRSQRLP